MEELLLSLSVLLLSLLLSLPNLRLLRSIFNSDQHPNVFDKSLAICLVISGMQTTLQFITEKKRKNITKINNLNV